MNILLIGTRQPTESMNGIGGAGIVAIKIAEHFGEKNNVIIIPRCSTKNLFEKPHNVINNVKYISMKIFVNRFLYFFNYMIKKEYSIILNYTKGKSSFKYLLLYFFNRSLAERIIYENKIDVINIHGHSIQDYAFIQAAINNKIPIICTSHGLTGLNSNIQLDYLKEFENFLFNYLILYEKTLIVAVSYGIKSSLQFQYQIPSSKIRVIPNGVDFAQFSQRSASKKELRHKYSLPENKTILLQVGTLSKLKNHIAILNAIANMDDSDKAKLLYLIVGDGSEKENILKFIIDNKIENNVILFGYVPPGKKLIELYQLSDFFILPSTSEGFPLVFLEALASGLPIITFMDIEGVQDIYTDECFEIIASRETNSIISSIRLAIGKKWNNDKIMDYAKKWSWESVYRKYDDIINNL